VAYRAIIFTVIFNRVVIYINNKARVREYFDLMFTALKNTTDEVFTFFYDDVVKKIKPSFRLETPPGKNTEKNRYSPWYI
jgi:hypothetical protein